MKNNLIILTGPTSAGKTNLSISLAKKINGEIISADSIQVYKGLDIGSGKITKEQMDGVTHHLIDICDPKEEFNIKIFQQKAQNAIEQIYEKGKIPIMVGGTGFYIQSVLYDIDFSEESDCLYRQKLEELANTKGKEYLHKQLQKVDPITAQKTHANNVKRIIRALEFYHMTGQPLSAHNEEQHQKDSPYNFCYFVLTDEREILYRKIEKRVDEMLELGLVNEVKRLKEYGCTLDMTSIQGLGYKEIYRYLMGECTLDEAVYTIKRDTRHFAKRQLTWFRREKDVIWLNKSDFCSETVILEEIMKHMKRKQML
ncbi:tRNA (adenosine(37)-N6)-dimethylallyltransferase MiaA [Eubacterium oxidoreducens]|uniref:tRNA dimethylallyltransferase n=1 Tax=Eubacterium oxidoreducens TaxID=1732 RepID=A0A1G6ALC7_EUBOX|nr:tRNA (adenosine(37)-N6)-dimethylallyltransferase MiaA [Eubacterium oxidoreducens]SDB09196.1 tRNA dimethylallyltransferase [Eubacterium oxidoreducens]